MLSHLVPLPLRRQQTRDETAPMAGPGRGEWARGPFLRCWQMLLILERGRQRAKWIEAEAESLIQHLGASAFGAAHSMEREATNFPSSVRYWRSVRKAIARETKIEVYRLKRPPIGSSRSA